MPPRESDFFGARLWSWKMWRMVFGGVACAIGGAAGALAVAHLLAQPALPDPQVSALKEVLVETDSAFSIGISLDKLKEEEIKLSTRERLADKLLKANTYPRQAVILTEELIDLWQLTFDSPYPMIVPAIITLT